MAQLEVAPFADEHVEDAGRVLAARHARQREVEPLLSERFEAPAAAREELVAAWRAEGASGAAGLRNGRLVGYLVGAPRDVEVWGENVWIEAAGHAVEEAEDVRDLYAAAATRWFEEERRR
ncbi:MAG: GNAT family N-acetyltransferase, partial [Gaiellaceae bacterium]